MAAAAAEHNTINGHGYGHGHGNGNGNGTVAVIRASVREWSEDELDAVLSDQHTHTGLGGWSTKAKAKATKAKEKEKAKARKAGHSEGAAISAPVYSEVVLRAYTEEHAELAHGTTGMIHVIEDGDDIPLLVLFVRQNVSHEFS